ncbi:MAG TPA: hypothetical protein VL654_04755 [Casimicrobiaceae bacterium]|jgi:hypothetical protein|nr:hypothetical protein [Casimicrobiaceae bacterium]
MSMSSCLRMAAVFLFAATASAAALGRAAPGSLRASGIDYLNGGIGSEEADRMRQMSAEYPVQMTFAERNQGADEFVADVHLRVVDGRGVTLVDLPDQGPIFLLQVPPGDYTVEAEHQGQVKTRRFDVAPGRHDRLGFEW